MHFFLSSRHSLNNVKYQLICWTLHSKKNILSLNYGGIPIEIGGKASATHNRLLIRT